MIHPKNILCFLSLFLGIIGHQHAQSRFAGASPCLARTVASDPDVTVLVFRSNGQIVHKGTSESPDADLAEMLNVLPKNLDGWLSIQLNAFGESPKPTPLLEAIQLGFEDEEGKQTYFTLGPKGETLYTYRDDTKVGEFSANLEVGSVVRVERKEKKLLLFVNDKTTPIATISDVKTSIVRFQVRLVRPNATITPQYASYSTGSCPPFVVLKHRLDASYLQQTDDVLRFKFQQRYGTANNQPEAIGYAIYDWQRNVVLDGTFDAQYGINWSEIQLDNLPDDTFYTLEITANKGEQYLLRFKTKQP